MTVDPAEIVKVLTHQRPLIGAHEQHISSLDAKLDELCAILKSCLPGSSVSVQTPAPIQPTSSVPLKLPLPENFGGDTEDCRGFLNVCHLHFRNNPWGFQYFFCQSDICNFIVKRESPGMGLSLPGTQ